MNQNFDRSKLVSLGDKVLVSDGFTAPEKVLDLLGEVRRGIHQSGAFANSPMSGFAFDSFMLLVQRACAESMEKSEHIKMLVDETNAIADEADRVVGDLAHQCELSERNLAAYEGENFALKLLLAEGADLAMGSLNEFERLDGVIAAQAAEIEGLKATKKSAKKSTKRTR